MTSLRFSHLRRVNVARQGADGFNQPLTLWSFDEWMIALGGEIGEALNLIKKLNRARDGIVGNTLPPADLLLALADELADAAIYLDLTLAGQKKLLCPGFADFAAFRHGSGDITSSSCGRSRAARNLLEWLGQMASGVEIERSGMRVFDFLDEIAGHAGIDLGEAVIRKFNATSEKLGMPHRLEAA